MNEIKSVPINYTMFIKLKDFNIIRFKTGIKYECKLNKEKSNMNKKKTITILVILIIVVSAITTVIGIFSSQGPGAFKYETIRGQTITIYGKGIYKHMSEDVAIQGIAQDYITLFIGIPLLLISLFLMWKGSLRGRFILAGTLGYFFVTFLFYLIMGMYNKLFLAYAFLMGASFFSFALTIMSFDLNELSDIFSHKTSEKFAGGFLIFNAFAITMLWLKIVIPPLINGTIYPEQLQHYTTLIVQGMDLGLLLPIGAVSGVLLIQKKPLGYLLGPIYFIFLSILMTALTAKLIAMGINGYNIIPAIFIIPVFAFISLIFTVLLLKNIKNK